MTILVLDFCLGFLVIFWFFKIKLISRRKYLRTGKKEMKRTRVGSGKERYHHSYNTLSLQFRCPWSDRRFYFWFLGVGACAAEFCGLQTFRLTWECSRGLLHCVTQPCGNELEQHSEIFAGLWPHVMTGQLLGPPSCDCVVVAYSKAWKANK